MQWAVDPSHSQITLSVKYLGISTVRGSFNFIVGTIDATELTIDGVTVTIHVDLLSTGDAKRDEHLRSPDFFDVVTFPDASFVLGNATRRGEALSVQGELTLRGLQFTVRVDGEQLTVPFGERRRLTPRTPHPPPHQFPPPTPARTRHTSARPPNPRATNRAAPRCSASRPLCDTSTPDTRCTRAHAQCVRHVPA